MLSPNTAVTIPFLRVIPYFVSIRGLTVFLSRFTTPGS